MSERALGKLPMHDRDGKPLPDLRVTPVQARVAIDTHLSDGRIGREMLAAERAVQQAKSAELNANVPPPSDAVRMPPPPPRAPTVPPIDYSDCAHRYYRTLFPVDAVHRWASRAWITDGPDAHKREWGWEGWSGSPFVRWKACGTPSKLREMVSGDTVGKINLGAMYEESPDNRYKIRGEMQAVAREFVIDIDLTDYPGGSTNLQQCDEMWPLVAVGLEACSQVLSKHFGFKHIMPVYSGRRGGHLWVCDRRACAMNNEMRDAIVKYMSPGENRGKTVWTWLIKHPGFKEISTNLMLPFWRERAIRPIEAGGLGMFDVAFQRKAFLELVHADCARDLGDTIGQHLTPHEALDALEQYLNRSRTAFILERYEEAVWQMIGPRIDVAVSKDAKHTLKIPFSVHPKTGRVSVPILSDRLNAFPVARRAPTVADLTDKGQRGEQSRHILNVTVENFQMFVDHIAKSKTELTPVPGSETTPPPSKKQCTFDMRGELATPPDKIGPVPIKWHADRICWVIQRVFTIQPDPDHTDVRVVLMKHSTPDGRDPTRMCKKDCFPPWPYRGRELSEEETVERLRRCVKQAKDDARTLHLHSVDRVIMLCSGPHTSTVEQAARRWRALEGRLSEGWERCKINVTWDDDAIDSMIRQQIIPYCETLGSL